MAFERLVPDGDDGGWTGGGTFADIDNNINSPVDSVHLDSGGSGSTDESVVLDFVNSGIVDADNIIGLGLRVRARSNGSGNDTLEVSYLGLTVDSGNLFNVFTDYFANRTEWNVDRTAAQMDAIQFIMTGRQNGMPAAHAHEISEVEIIVVYEPDSPVFGQVVKGGFGESLGSLVTAPLGGSAKAGNLLYAAVGNNDGTQTITSFPAGYTAVNGAAGAAIWDHRFKIAAGGETAAAWQFSSSGNPMKAVIIEIEWDGSTPDITKNENESQINSVTTTINTGAITPLTNHNVVVAVIGADQENFALNNQQLSPDEYTDETWFLISSQNNNGVCKMGVAVDMPVASTIVTHNHSSFNDELYGAITCFDVPAAGDPVGILKPKLQTKHMKHILGR